MQQTRSSKTERPPAMAAFLHHFQPSLENLRIKSNRHEFVATSALIGTDMRQTRLGLLLNDHHGWFIVRERPEFLRADAVSDRLLLKKSRQR
jgi:hypothetical protein